MPHSFNLTIQEELSSVLERVESEITKQGGRFQGNSEGGTFAGRTPIGMVKGEYRVVSASEITILITEKPFLVPYSLIEDQIRSYFA